MLKNPPCIRLLVGCLETDSSSTDTSSDSAHVGLTLGGRRSSSTEGSSSSSSRTPSTSTSLSGLEAYLPSYASGALISRSQKLYRAHYTLTARNISTSSLQGVKIVHGPLPFGAEFDAQRSDPSCLLQLKTVECTINLPSGAQRDLSVTYKASHSMSCAFARLLEKAKAKITSLSGVSSDAQVTVSVTCAMESETSDQGFGMRSNTPIIGQKPIEGSGGLFGASGFKDSGYKQGYSTTIAVMPRTGAMHDYFASVATPTNMIIQRHEQISSFSMIPILMLSILSVVVFFVVLKRSIRTIGF